MPSPIPRRNRWVRRSSGPEATAFPQCQRGRLPRYLFRGLLSVHSRYGLHACQVAQERPSSPECSVERVDRKSTRLNSSHGYISYAVFCLKKKKKTVQGSPAAASSHTSI